MDRNEADVYVVANQSVLPHILFVHRR